ncbi:hypothetical protein B0I37DRAFT_353527 [Chaetomium sp. MPI-CAGE-AT-0009]|nr:hypothetical protein B0I37DRAFT_353527 [Chaetomium sp. MPI-CAGE-AT-0009]
MLHVVAISAACCCRTPSGNIAELGGLPRIKGRETAEESLGVRAFNLARIDSGFRRGHGDDPYLPSGGEAGGVAHWYLRLGGGLLFVVDPTRMRDCTLTRPFVWHGLQRSDKVSRRLK